jgi:hypothetical protein
VANIWADSCGDHYDIASLLRKWTASTGTITIVAGRFGGNALSMTALATLTKTIAANATKYTIGIAFNLPALPTATQIMVSFTDGGSTQVDLRVTAAGNLQVTRNGTQLGSNSVSVLTTGYHYIELSVLINASTGTVDLKVDESTSGWISLTGQNTRATANTQVNGIKITAPVANTVIDDIYLNDSAGSVNNGFIGDKRIAALTVTGIGTTNSWLPVGQATADLCVDDPVPNDDTDYISSNVVNDVSTFPVTDIPAASSPSFVQVLVLARKDDAGTRTVATAIRSGGTNYFGSNFNLSASYQYAQTNYDTDPATGVAWTVAGVNALEAGAKMIA